MPPLNEATSSSPPKDTTKINLATEYYTNLVKKMNITQNYVFIIDARIFRHQKFVASSFVLFPHLLQHALFVEEFGPFSWYELS